MTAWSLEHMGIAIYCLSYIENLRQAFTAATLSCCLFVALYALSFVFSYWKAYSVAIKEYPISCPWGTIRALLQFVLRYYPFALGTVLLTHS